jgi:spore maturation protein CgeB
MIIVHDSADVVRTLRDMPEATRVEMGARARGRVLAAHTGAHRAAELVAYTREHLAR